MTGTSRPSARGKNRRPNRAATLFALCALLYGCGKPTDTPPVEATPQPTPTITLETPKNAAEQKLAVERGHNAFYTYGCWHCHAIGDEEAPGMRNKLAMGPDMADVGSRLGPDEILQSILDPNAVIAEPREQHTAEGISLMPAFDNPQAMDDIRDIVLFLQQCKLPESSQPEMAKVTDENFSDTVEKHDGMVLLYFWAEWCFACLAVGPALEELAPDYRERIKFCKVEIDENPLLVEKHVPDRSFPCLVILKDNKVLGRHQGIDPDTDPTPLLKDWFKKFAP